MKLKRVGAAFSSAILAFSSLLTLMTPGIVHASVNTCTWTGATDLKFSTAGNWSGCASAAPVNGDNLVFDVTSLSADATLNNDITNLTTGTVTFSGNNSSFFSYKVTGNDLTLGGNLTSSSVPGSTLDLNVKLGADVTVAFSNSSYLNFGEYDDSVPLSIDTQGHSLSLSGTADSCGLDVWSKLVGSGGFTTNLSGSAVTLVRDSSTYTGAVTISGGQLLLDDGATLGNTSGVTVNGGRLRFQLAQDRTFGYPLSLSGNGGGSGTLAADIGGTCDGSAPSTIYTATLTGPVTLNSDIQYSGVYNTNVTGTFTANGHSVTNITGATGTFTAGGNTTQVTLSQRTIDASDSQPSTQEYAATGEVLTLDGVRGDTEVANKAILMGSGTVGTLMVDEGGTVAPGHSPGCMTVSNGLKEYGTYQAQIGGTDPCTGYDQLKVTGTVDLGGSNGNAQGILDVSLYNGFKPAAGQSYTIIDNDGTDAVQGTFANLAEGATFTVGDYVFQISYKGGDGNDVVVSVKNVPGTPDTGFALIAANPLLSLALTTVAAAGILIVAQKTRTAKAVARRRH